jgi:hypothetical protein
MGESHAAVENAKAAQRALCARQEALADAKSRKLTAINHKNFETFARHINGRSTTSRTCTNHQAIDMQ